MSCEFLTNEHTDDSLQNVERIPCTATEDNVDVFMGGYAFRLRILHERGLNLVKGECEILLLNTHNICYF